MGRLVYSEKAALNAVDAIVIEGFTAAGKDVVDLAQSRAPVDTGQLRDGIFDEIHEGNEIILTIGVDAAITYAEIQEEKHRFLESAVEDIAPFIPDYIEDAARRSGR